jgi:selenocysteine lyase/cysteine desulfurase
MIRDKFCLPQQPYFLSHSVGCLPVLAQHALRQQYFTPWQQLGGDAWPTWLSAVDQFRDQIAILLSANTSDICPQPNLSSGWTKFLESLPKHADRNQVVMHANAFPSMGFVVSALEQKGLQAILIPADQSANDIDAWQQVIGSRTLCALITHVHSNTGVLSDVPPIAQLCKQQGCYSVVDVAQSAGIIPIDVKMWGVDAVLGSCVKWLCGGPGAGFLWVNPAIIEQLCPTDVGWFSHQNPFEMDIRHFQYAKDALRFWGGTPSVASYIVAASSVELINQLGVEDILRHNKALAAQLLSSLPAQLGENIDLTKIGGTLCLTADEKHIALAEQRLKTQQVHFDRRGNTLRLSLHIYNTADELDCLSQAFA